MAGWRAAQASAWWAAHWIAVHLSGRAHPQGPADPHASAGAAALFTNLRASAAAVTLFGHQNDLATGYGWHDEPGRSDVKAVAGAYPAVIGWDVGEIFGRDGTYDPARAERLRRYIAESYALGAVVTLSWHMPNPAGGDAWTVSHPAVERVLWGGDLHRAFLRRLDVAADFFRSLRAADGRPIPVVFRPWHEHSGDWFWWGRAHCTAAEYKALWRLTVHRIRDVDGAHNLLWAYSPDVFDSREAYLERYPGDDLVDVLGFDDYHGVADRASLPRFSRRLRLVVQMAEARGKIPAVTETGLEALPNPVWWTDVLQRGLDADPVGRRVAWVMVWRNADPRVDRHDHFYAPYPGQASVADFRRFVESPRIRLADRAPDPYREGVAP